MILRKPYAFLIKNFKLIHAIITAFMVYFFYKSIAVMSFFGEYILSDQNIIGEETSSSLFTGMMFLLPLLVIILSIVLLVVMVVKKKPYVLYVVNILIYAYAVIMLGLARSTVSTMEVMLVDIRTIKLIRDLNMISMCLQLYPILKSFIRTVGFDIKKFNFGEDLAELEIEEKDNEEFEVNVNIDTNKMKRGMNSKNRIFKYIYAENSFLINMVAIVFVLIVCALTTYGIYKYNETTPYNKSFNISGFAVKVLETYSTRLDYKGNVLSNLNDRKSLIIVSIDIKNNNKLNKQFPTVNVPLVIGNHKFYPDGTYRDSLIDIGSVYDSEIINSGDESKKLLVYQVPTTYLTHAIDLKFISSIDIKGKELIPTYVTVPVSLTDLDSDTKTTSITLSNENSLSTSILGDSKFTINSVDMSSRFKVDYKYCVTTSSCVDSYEYLLAELNTNKDKSLMKISGNVTYSSDVTAFSSLYDLFNYFGAVKYDVDGQTKTINSGLNKINPTFLKSNTTIYVSIPREAETSSHVSLLFRIRNQQYEYVIK